MASIARFCKINHLCGGYCGQKKLYGRDFIQAGGFFNCNFYRAVSPPRKAPGRHGGGRLSRHPPIDPAERAAGPGCQPNLLRQQGLRLDQHLRRRAGPVRRRFLHQVHGEDGSGVHQRLRQPVLRRRLRPAVGPHGGRDEHPGPEIAFLGGFAPRDVPGVAAFPFAGRREPGRQRLPVVRLGRRPVPGVLRRRRETGRRRLPAMQRLERQPHVPDRRRG